PWEKVLGRRLKKSEWVRVETTKPVCTWSRFETGDTQLVKVGMASNLAPEHQKGILGSLPKGMFGGLLRLYEDQVLHFMHDFCVPFDDNLTQRDIGIMKLLQKIS